jgi:hypothetical protein
MAGVRLDDEPDFASGLKLERVPRGQGQVHFYVNAAIHPHNHDDVTLL